MVLITATETAEILGVARTTVYDLAQRGVLTRHARSRVRRTYDHAEPEALSLADESSEVLGSIELTAHCNGRSVSMSDSPTHEYTPGLHGWITHTELSSDDPAATRDWCAGVLGWTLQPALSSPTGDYHLFAYSEQGGGGVRQTSPGEAPGSTPTVHVDDTDRVYQMALDAGADSVAEPHDIMPGVRIALVRAPGGVLIGLSGPTT